MGTHFECVGAFDPPSCEESTVVPLPRSFSNLATEEPITGLTVKVCARLDDNCDAPSHVATTETNWSKSRQTLKSSNGA